LVEIIDYFEYYCSNTQASAAERMTITIMTKKQASIVNSKNIKTKETGDQSSN